MSSSAHPIEGQIVLLAGAKASVTLTSLSHLLERTQQYVHGRKNEYDRQFERIDGTGDITSFRASRRPVGKTPSR